MNAIITIDSLGKLKNYQVVKSKKHKETFSKKLEERYMQWFFLFKCPIELYNSKF